MEQYVLHVTHQCNLRCKYCYEKNRETTYSQEEIRKTCDEIIKCAEPYRVEFIGGEPTLAWDNIEFAYKYIKANSDRVQSFTISTNLTILNERMIEWIRWNEDVSLSISLDGGRYANQLRVWPESHGTYELVAENIKRAITEFGVDRVRVHMVAHPYNVALLAHSVDHIYSLGIRSIAVGIIESTMDIDEEFGLRYLKEMNEISKRRFTGQYPGLNVSEQDSVKPIDDQRTYVYDEDGKMIFESYGRAKDDAITNGDVKAEPVSGRTTKLINGIRLQTHRNHMSRMERKMGGKNLLNGFDKIEAPEVTLSMLKGEMEAKGLSLSVSNPGPGVFIADLDGASFGYSQGKGETEVAAKVSCLAEYVERSSMLPGMFSNGCAVGNSREEAIYQACAEIFERYHLYQSVTSDSLYPTVDPLSIEDKKICELYFWFLKKGYKVYIKELSVDFPTYGVYFENCKKDLNDPTRYSYRVGTSFNSNQAILRAFMEKFQILLDTEGVRLNEPLKDMLENGRSSMDTTSLMKGQLIKYQPREHKHLSDHMQELQAILCMLDADIEITELPNDYLPAVSVRIEGMMNMFKEEQ